MKKISEYTGIVYEFTIEEWEEKYKYCIKYELIYKGYNTVVAEEKTYK